MKTLFRILGTAAAVAVTGAAIVALDKLLNEKDPLHVESVEFPEDAPPKPPGTKPASSTPPRSLTPAISATGKNRAAKAKV